MNNGFSNTSETKNDSLYNPTEDVSTLFDRFIKEKQFLANLSPRTIHSYKENFNRWQKHVGEFPAAHNLSQFVVALREAGLSVTTCNICIRSFNSFLSWLHENQYTKDHLRVKKLKEEKRVMKTFTDEQIKALLSYRPGKGRNEQRAYALLCLLIDTGVRISEALSLDVTKIDFHNLLITVKGKGNKERIVPMSIELRKILYRYMTRQRYSRFRTKYCFCTSNGTMMTYQNLRRDLQVIFKSVGVDCDNIDGGFHAFRRKFARSYVKAGGNLFYLQAAMGHTTLQMTRHYVEIEEEELKEAHARTSLLSRLR